MIKINGVEVNFENFPNKETKLILDQDKYDLNKKYNEVLFQWTNDADLIKLLFVKRHIDMFCPTATSRLYIAYMPYSRMDRVEDISEVFTLKHIADFINNLKFNFVIVLEPHSEVTCALLNNAISMNFTEILFNDAVGSGNIEFNPKEDFLCYPDATAHKRYGKIGDYNGIIGMKDRDFKTGWIKNLDIYVPEGYSVQGRNVVILDDLCCKGGTFILTAKELIRIGAKSITLIVAHCESSILDGDILKTDIIDKVVTSNTIVDQNKLASFEKVLIADFEEYL